MRRHPLIPARSVRAPRCPRGVLLAVLATAFLAACTDRHDPQSAPPVAPIGLGEGTQVQPSGDYRLRLEGDLAAHALRAGDAMRATIAGDPRASAAVDALAENTRAVAQGFELAYGFEAFDTVVALWERRNEQLVAYAQALGAGDAEAESRARTALTEDAANVAAYLEAVTASGAPAEATERLVIDGLGFLLSHADEYARSDPAAALSAQRAAVQAHVVTGRALAGAVAASMPERFFGQVAGEGVDERSSLAHLFGESTALTAQLLRHVVAPPPGADEGAPAPAPHAPGQGDAERAAVRAAVNSVTVELAAALPQGGSEFAALWSARADALAASAAAVAADDPAARAAADAAVADTQQALGTWMGSATGGRLDAASFADLLAISTELLVPHTAAWARGDYAQAYDLDGEAWVQARSVGERVAQALSGDGASAPGG